MSKSVCIVTQRERISSARSVLEQGGSLLDVAECWGISKAGACMYLGKHDPGLREELALSKPTSSRFTREEALFRLRIIKSRDDRGTPRCKTAQLLGINPAALSMWIDRWTSGDVDQTILDLED